MERLSLDIIKTSAVHIITRERMPDTAHMAAYLMCPACFEPQLAERMRVGTIKRLIMSYGRIAVRTYTALYLAVRLQSDRSVNDSALAYRPFTYRDISLFYRRLHERICYAVFSNDNTTGGISIETVQRAEGIALSPALLIISYDVGQSIKLMDLYGMYRHTVGLIDYEQAVRAAAVSL